MISLRRLIPVVRERARLGTAIIAIVVSAATLVLVASLGSIEQVSALLARLDWRWVGVGACLMILMHFVIAARLLLVLDRKATGYRFQALDVCFIHSGLLHVLPARLGDVVYPFMLKRNLDVEGSRALLNLIVIRLNDFLIAALLVVLMLMGPAGTIGTGTRVQYAAVGIAVTAMLIMIALPSIVNFTAGVLKRFQWYQNHGSAAEFLDQIIASYQQLSWHRHLLILLSTIVRWLLSALMLLSLFKAVGVQLSVFGALLITGGVTLSVALPIQTIGGFGVVEIAMVFFLVLLGMDKAPAAEITLACRLVWVLSLLAVVGAWLAIARVARNLDLVR